MKLKLLVQTILLGSLAIAATAQAYISDIATSTNSTSYVYLTVSSQDSYCNDVYGTQVGIKADYTPFIDSSDSCQFKVQYSNNSDYSQSQVCANTAQNPLTPPFTINVTRATDNSLSCTISSSSTKAAHGRSSKN